MDISLLSFKSLSARSIKATETCKLCSCICCHKVFPQRYCMTIMLIFGLSIAYMQRVGLNLAIVVMVKAVSSNVSVQAICKSGEKKSAAAETKLNDQQFQWDEQVQSYILLSFYIGYMVGNMPAGFFTDWWGARWFILGGMALSSVTTGIIPPLAYYCHWSTLVVARIFAGLGQSVYFPGASSLISKWIPNGQKSSITSIVMTSYTFGTMMGNFFTGYIIQWTSTWAWMYYIYAILGAIWLFFFYFYVYSDPYHHPHVTVYELEDLATMGRPSVIKKTPVRRMLTDMAVWAMFIGEFGSDYTLFTILTNMPKYFTTVLNISTQMTGTLLMIPPFVCFLGSFVFGFSADALIRKNKVKKVTFRVLASFLALPASTACMVFMTFMECNRIVANVALCMAMFCKSAFYSGVGMLALDISKNYSGVIIGFATAWGSLAGMIAPYIIGLVAAENSFPQWMLIQYLSAAISVVTLIPYLMFVKAGRKDWDYGAIERRPDELDEQVPVCKRIWSCHDPV